MAKLIQQIIERERSDGYKEVHITVVDTVTGETKVGWYDYYYDCDRDVRHRYCLEDLMR